VKDMFGDVVDPSIHIGNGQKWYTKLLSIAVHAVLIGIVVIVPLLATDSIPPVDKALFWEPPPKPPVPVKIKGPQDPKRNSRGGGNKNNPEPRVPTEPPPKVNPEPPGREPGPTGREPDPCPGCLEVDAPTPPNPEPPRPPLPPPPPKPEPPRRPGEGIKEPVKVFDVKPDYPRMAQDAKVQGLVILEAIIAPDGSVGSVRVLRSIPLLDAAAANAVRQWRYAPSTFNGRPISVILTVTLNFTLQ
jgi:protein TonB